MESEAGSLYWNLASSRASGCLRVIRRCKADVLSNTSQLRKRAPAVDPQAGPRAGMHAITANKGPVVHAYRQ
jgi:hypothetical protein